MRAPLDPLSLVRFPVLRALPFLCCLVVGGLVLTACTDPNKTTTSCDGVSDNTPCGTTPKGLCDAQDVCKQGVCVAKSKADGATCGSVPTGACAAPSTCKAGACVPQVKNNGSACGSAPASACAAQDVCQAGACTAQAVPDGTACGDAADGCHDVSVCSAGACAPKLRAVGTVCKAAGDVTCDRDDVCDAAGSCVATVAPVGTGCRTCQTGAGNCGACAAGSCPDACPAGSGTTLEMPATAKDGNQHDGVMFNLRATKALAITAFDTVLSGPKGVVEIRVYPGDYKNVEGSAAAWKLVATVTPGSVNAPPASTPLPLSTPVLLKAGDTLGVYITGTGGAAGALVALGPDLDGDLAGDAALTVTSGKSIKYPFMTTLAFRDWNGRVSYRVSDTLALGSDKTVAAGVMFDLLPLHTVRLKTLRVGLAPGGPYSLTLHQRFGSYAEAPTDVTRWTQLLSVSGVVPDVEEGATLTLPGDGMVLPEGVRSGLAVTSLGGVGIDVTKAAQAGVNKGSSGSVQLFTGLTLSAPFAPTAQAATPSGSATFSVCP